MSKLRNSSPRLWPVKWQQAKGAFDLSARLRWLHPIQTLAYAQPSRSGYCRGRRHPGLQHRKLDGWHSMPKCSGGQAHQPARVGEHRLDRGFRVFLWLQGNWRFLKCSIREVSEAQESEVCFGLKQLAIRKTAASLDQEQEGDCPCWVAYAG